MKITGFCSVEFVKLLICFKHCDINEHYGYAQWTRELRHKSQRASSRSEDCRMEDVPTSHSLLRTKHCL
jgi:hypothetical protein